MKLGRELSNGVHAVKRRCSMARTVNSRGVNMDGILLDAMTAGNQFYDTADIAADIVDPGRRKSVLDVPSNELFFS